MQCSFTDTFCLFTWSIVELDIRTFQTFALILNSVVIDTHSHIPRAMLLIEHHCPILNNLFHIVVSTNRCLRLTKDQYCPPTLSHHLFTCHHFLCHETYMLLTGPADRVTWRYRTNFRLIKKSLQLSLRPIWLLGFQFQIVYTVL